MVTRTQAREILDALFTLPPEKVAEVYDSVAFLQEHYGRRTAMDESDTWNEEDMHDLIQASLVHAERTVWTGSDQSLILQISNHHTAGCGTLPRIEERPGQYLGYFENQYGEQMIFIFDRRSGTGRVYAGDAGWETPYKVIDGVAKELILTPEEGLWLRACWGAATAWDR